MLTGFAEICDLEIRAGRGKGRHLRGRFPYGKRAVLSDGGKKGRPRKEVIQPRAFAYRINRPDEDIHLLVGHSYDRPLASRGAGTLDIRDTDAAVIFEAEIVPEVADTPYGADFLGAFDAGLIRGISPGFRIPPERTVPDAETVEEEDPREGLALIRNIWAALLYELSLVTVPAYREASAEDQGRRPGTPKNAGKVIVSDKAPIGTDRNPATLWVDSSEGFTPKRWNGSAWVAANDREAIAAARDAEDERRWAVSPGGIITPANAGLHRTLQRWRP